MLVEALAYTADQLSYQQDAVATEAYLGTARRRVSIRRHARLMDYFARSEGATPGPGCRSKFPPTWSGRPLQSGHSHRAPNLRHLSRAADRHCRRFRESMSRPICCSRPWSPCSLSMPITTSCDFTVGVINAVACRRDRPRLLSSPSSAAEAGYDPHVRGSPGPKRGHPRMPILPDVMSCGWIKW